MSEISKAYEPKAVEEKWYQFWLDEKCFVADASSHKPAYSIVIPPPNVTGVLTLGHVLNNTIQDILARKARMEGHEVLWLPGTDHAGIATQTVVERALRKEGVIKHRDDLGREKFLEKVWEWKEKHGGIIIQQLKKLGCSCDWSRERFTMDAEYSRCVSRVFVHLYKKGLIYHGKRMVNWDPVARTALSDEEVIMTEEKGHLWHLKYPLLDEQGQPEKDKFLVVATTRPETMLGDEAVAVNPKDERYQHLVGKKAFLPLQNKIIPVIADELVDPKFGTGCVKVTPAHDPADYEMALRHKLPLTVVIGPDGKMTAAAGEDFEGLDRYAAREAVIEELKEQGLLLKVEDYVHNVGHSERSHVPVEPYLSEQWFLKYPCVEQAIECVAGSATVPVADSGVAPESSSGGAGIPAGASEAAGTSGPGDSGETPESAGATPALPQMHFYPERWSKTYTHWMGNIKDWCISRQLWWGHRVPVWTRETLELNAKAPSGVQDDAALAQFLCAMSDTKSYELSLSEKPGESTFFRCSADGERWEAVTDSAEEGSFLEAAGFTQDADVLDTWFSSWLWPFATMGWPEQTDTLKKFYPTTALVTGPDIIFFWVARMIMAGYEFMGELPFRDVYFTGIIRDKLGRKMSKSLGNSPDPLDLIAKFGADALRFGIIRSAPLGQDLLFDEQHIELGRNFCNKLWNACRFRQMQGGEVQGEIVPELLTSDDKWILLKLDQAILELTASLAEYKFSEAAATLYRFFWSEFCDWYLEACKAALGSARVSRADPGVAPGSPLNRESSGATPDDATGTVALPEATARLRANTLAVLDFVQSHTLRLFHPFLPFITEELWHGMGYHEDMPPNQGGKTILFAPWPQPLGQDFRDHYSLDDCYLEFAEAKQELVVQGRNLRREKNIPANKRVKFILKPPEPVAPHDQAVLKILLNAEALDVDPNFQAPKGMPSVRVKLGELYMPVEGLIDVAAEKGRLAKELEKAKAEIAKIQQKLANPAFAEKAPPAVLQEHQRRLAEWQAKQEQVLKALDESGGSA